MRHTVEAKKKIGDASRERGSAAIALAARWANRITKCSVEGCENIHEAKGFCGMHYQRLKKTGALGGAGRASNKKGSAHINAFGYRITGRRGEHIAVAEKAIGRAVPATAVVHHANEDKLDNRPQNLVICQDKAYHNLIHARARALEECGNANWMKCPFCGKYDAPENMYVYPNRRAAKHRECYAKYRAAQKCH